MFSQLKVRIRDEKWLLEKQVLLIQQTHSFRSTQFKHFFAYKNLREREKCICKISILTGRMTLSAARALAPKKQLSRD